MNENETVKGILLNIVDRLDANTSNVSEDDCIMIAKVANTLTNTENKLSKYQACKYLGVSIATFDNWVKSGILPKGRKEQGFKEKFWLLEDIKNVNKN